MPPTVTADVEEEDAVEPRGDDQLGTVLAKDVMEALTKAAATSLAAQVEPPPFSVSRLSTSPYSLYPYPSFRIIILPLA